MNEKELRELLQDLQEKGWGPMLCDTPVPKYDSSVPCGEPVMGYGESWETVLLPKELLSMHPEFLIPVRGDSMKNAGIITGDVVKVIGDVTPQEGDIVLACIDGEYTLKTYFEDEDGRQWLVPQNDDYEPILLDERENVKIFGKVKQIIKQAPRVASKFCMKAIRKVLNKQEKPVEITALILSQAIRAVAPMVKKGRQWYAVYRVLVDCLVVKEDDFDGFIDIIVAEVPKHEHLPKRLELQRMAVQSFAKKMALWRPDYAPVKGTRFTEYVKIAHKTQQLLGVA